MATKSKRGVPQGVDDPIEALHAEVRDLKRRLEVAERPKGSVRVAARDLARELRTCVRTGLRTVWRDAKGNPLVRAAGGKYRDAELAGKAG